MPSTTREAHAEVRDLPGATAIRTAIRKGREKGERLSSLDISGQRSPGLFLPGQSARSGRASEEWRPERKRSAVGLPLRERSKGRTRLEYFLGSLL